MNDKNNKRGGYYWVNGKPLLSVTTILGIIDKSNALMPWACGETYDAVIKDPTISREKAINAHRDISESAKGRGSGVHSIVESYKNINEVVGLDGPLKQYAIAFKSWLDTHKPEILEQEKTVSSAFRYGGTLDMIAKVGDKTCLIDVKTNKDGRLFPEIQLQLSAYSNALHESGVYVEEMYGLALAPDGTYTFKSFEYNFEPFLAAKILYEWKNRPSLIKIGYLEKENQ